MPKGRVQPAPGYLRIYLRDLPKTGPTGPRRGPARAGPSHREHDALSTGRGGTCPRGGRPPPHRASGRRPHGGQVVPLAPGGQEACGKAPHIWKGGARGGNRKGGLQEARGRGSTRHQHGAGSPSEPRRPQQHAHQRISLRPPDVIPDARAQRGQAPFTPDRGRGPSEHLRLQPAPGTVEDGASLAVRESIGMPILGRGGHVFHVKRYRHPTNGY